MCSEGEGVVPYTEHQAAVLRLWGQQLQEIDSICWTMQSPTTPRSVSRVYGEIVQKKYLNCMHTECTWIKL